MVESLYLKGLLHIHEERLEFDKGLVVFTGPSGAGKSLLMGALLGAFGYEQSIYPELCELLVGRPEGYDLEGYELDDLMGLKLIKKEQLRYFIEGQKVSKKLLRGSFEGYVRHMSVRGKQRLSSDDLLEVLDGFAAMEDLEFERLKREIADIYGELKAATAELEALESKERDSQELLSRYEYEYEQLRDSDPQADEIDTLMETKQQLSQIDKIGDVVKKVEPLFALEGAIGEFYRIIQKDSSLIDEAMMQIRSDIDYANSLTLELEATDIEALLDRLGQLTSLQKRYGSIEMAIERKEELEKLIASFETIVHDKKALVLRIEEAKRSYAQLADRLSKLRKASAKILEEQVNGYLGELKLGRLSFVFGQSEGTKEGIDQLAIDLDGSSEAHLSGGEFNRLRLALMASVAKSTKSGGVIIVDELDANVSGDESIAIAKMIKVLSQSFQIFAISHQPHLAAIATNHYCITKDESGAKIELLDEAGRIAEIARIIAGERADEAAMAFAKELRSQLC